MAWPQPHRSPAAVPRGTDSCCDLVVPSRLRGDKMAPLTRVPGGNHPRPAAPFKVSRICRPRRHPDPTLLDRVTRDVEHGAAVREGGDGPRNRRSHASRFAQVHAAFVRDVHGHRPIGGEHPDRDGSRPDASTRCVTAEPEQGPARPGRRASSRRTSTRQPPKTARSPSSSSWRTPRSPRTRAA